MCDFGGGSSQYDAYKSGDFQRYKTAFDTKADVETRLAKGEIDQAEADRLLKGTQITPDMFETFDEMVPIYGPTGEGGSRQQTGSETKQSQRFKPEFAHLMPAGGGSAIDQLTGRGTPQLPAVGSFVGGAGNLDDLENTLKQDPSAQMEMREMKRQHDVGLGRIGIDKAFSKFGDDYYQQYRDDYSGFYFPQLDDQFGEVVDKTTASLADRGMLESGVGASQFGKLAKQHADARTNIANEGLDASNKLRGTVENAKSNLYSLNEASADPQAVNAAAVGQATSLVAPPTYSPLGQVFASALNTLGNFQQARQNVPTRRYQSPYANTGGYGSGTVVN